ncbi:MAG: hypothetical protein OEQ74_05050 [Gammaproteobacteria bacterium]|nr:hypothetical protein [Gammaproteobacteria bacterium]
MPILITSASATTTSNWVELESPGGASREVIATLTAVGTFGTTTQVDIQTSPDGGTHSVDLYLDPDEKHAFCTSGNFSSAGAMDIVVGHGQSVRAIAKPATSADVTTLFINF